MTGEDWGSETEFGFLTKDPDNPDQAGVQVLLDRESDDVPGTDGGCFGTGIGEYIIC